MQPAFSWIMRGSTAWMVWKAPSTLTAKRRRQKSSVMS